MKTSSCLLVSTASVPLSFDAFSTISTAFAKTTLKGYYLVKLNFIFDDKLIHLLLFSRTTITKICDDQ